MAPLINITLGNNKTITSINYYRIYTESLIKVQTIQKVHLDYLLENYIITKKQYHISKKALDKWCLHSSHYVGQVKVYDANINTYTYLNYYISSQSSDIVVVPSVIDVYFGITQKSYPTIKVTDSLYLTSHNFITEIKKNDIYTEEFKIDLELKPLAYDVNEKCLRNEEGKLLKNLTESNLKLIEEIIKKDVMSREIPKVDITSHVYIEDSILAVKVLDTNDFMNNEKFENIESQLQWTAKLKEKANDLIQQKLEKKREFKSLIIAKKPEDEL